MHTAPSVSFPVGRSRFAAGSLLMIWLAAALAIGLWWAQVQTPGWLAGAGTLLLAGVGISAALNWVHAPVRALVWDGSVWRCDVQGKLEEGEPAVSLDLQRWLLLRWTSGQRVRWLWLEQARGVERWGDVRRAVYSRARPQALRQAKPPAAKP
jgi:toxin CptA